MKRGMITLVISVLVTMTLMINGSAAEMNLSYKIATEMTELNEVFMDVEGSGVSEGALVNVAIVNSAENKKLYIEQLVGNSENEFALQLDLEAVLEESGNYTFMASAQSGVSGEFDFSYTRLSDLKALVDTINGIKNADKTEEAKLSELAGYLAEEETKNVILYINPTVKEMVDKDCDEVIAEFLLDETITVDNAKDVVTKISVAVVMSDKSAAEIKELFETYSTQLDINSVVTDFDKETAETKARVYERLSALSEQPESMDGFYSQVLETLALSKLDIAQGNNSVLSILEKYPTLFDLTVYNESDNDKAAMLNKIEKAFEDDAVARATDVQDILDAKIKKTTGGTGTGTGAGTSSSGGGLGFGGGSGAVVGSSAVDQTKVDFEETVEYQGIAFNDLEGFEWAVDSIEELVHLGVLSGHSNTVYAPGENVTRAQLCKMLCKLFGVQESEVSAGFEDVNEDDWYFTFVNAMYSEGIINGVGENRFAPDELVSRQDAAVMIHRALTKYAQISADEETEQFVDSDEISEYALEACNVLKQNEIIQGKGENNFAPLENMTRAEAAKFISNVYHFVEGN